MNYRGILIFKTFDVFAQFVSIKQDFIRTIIFFLLVVQFSCVYSGDSNVLPRLSSDEISEIYYKNIARENLVIIRNVNTESDFQNVQSAKTKIRNPIGRYSQAIEIANFNSLFLRNTNLSAANNIGDLFFPLSEYGKTDKLQSAIKSGELKPQNFKLECLNITANGLTEHFFNMSSYLSHSAQYNLLLKEYFSYLRLIKLTSNKIKHLDTIHFDIFKNTKYEESSLEAILLDSNRISSIRHNTFHGLNNLKYIDLSNNRLKIVHPLTFSVFNSQLTVLNLAKNRLRAVFYTPLFKDYNISNSTNFDELIHNQTNPLSNLKYLYLKGNQNLNCDCGLLWLFHIKDSVAFDDFTCNFVTKSNRINTLSNQTEEIFTSQATLFNSIKNESFFRINCKDPKIFVDTERLDQTSSYSLFRSFSNRWFDWTLLVDKVPVTTPYPYLMSDEKKEEINSALQQFQDYIEYLNRNDSEKIGSSLDNQEKHVFHTWRTSDVTFDCTNVDSDGKDESNSTIIWKTQHGYLSFLDRDLTDTLNSYLNEELGIEETDLSLSGNRADVPFNEQFRNSFKIFYQMNKLTKIYNNITVKVGQKFGGQTFSNFIVNSNNQLTVTNIRQIVAGPFVCISINEKGIKTYEYDIHVRVGIDEYFIYCLFVSVMSGIIPSVISLIICCICEYKAARDYNINRHYTCHTTPMGTTPPNFDFNDWMANAASYLPNLKINDTLDQVSKKLRSGIGKASIAVKSLGINSSAYIYSVYEHSSQRWMDIKGYVPTLHVPTLTLPTMKYPPVGEIANRMRTGMGNMLGQVREFCGTSDLNNTASYGDLEFHTNANSAVGGQACILDKIAKKNDSEHEQQRKTQFENYYRFLNFLREESRKVNRKKNVQNLSQNKIVEESECENTETLRETIQNSDSNNIQPTTSASANDDKFADEPTVVALPKLNMIITFSNVNDDIQRIEPMSEYDNQSQKYAEDYHANKEMPSSLIVQADTSSIPFIDKEQPSE